MNFDDYEPLIRIIKKNQEDIDYFISFINKIKSGEIPINDSESYDPPNHYFTLQYLKDSIILENLTIRESIDNSERSNEFYQAEFSPDSNQ